MRVGRHLGLASLALVAACSAQGGASPAASPAAASPAAAGTAAAGAAGIAGSVGTACPASAETSAPPWPDTILSSVPRIPSAVLGPLTHSQGITYVHFTTGQSLRDGVLVLLRSLRTSGFVVGRGDAEATEADAPFASATLLGSVRLTVLSNCSTGWLLAVTPRGNGSSAPLIPHARSTSAPSSPAPFA